MDDRLCFLSELNPRKAGFVVSTSGRLVLLAAMLALGAVAWFSASQAGMGAARLDYKAEWSSPLSDPLGLSGVFVTVQKRFGYFGEGSLGLFAFCGVPLLLYFSLGFVGSAGKTVAVLVRTARLVPNTSKVDGESATQWVARMNKTVPIWFWALIWSGLTLLGVINQRNEMRLARLRVEAHDAGIWFGYDPTNVHFTKTSDGVPVDEMLGWDFGTYQAPWTKVCADVFSEWGNIAKKPLRKLSDAPAKRSPLR